MLGLFADVVLLVVAMALGGVERNVGRAAGALWLWLSWGMGGTVFVIMISVIHGKKQRLPRRNRSTTLLIVNYGSGCEPHATNFGGAVIFEQKEGATVFRGYQPGFQANDCITLARNGKQDRLICITGHLGQGHLESGVAEMVFTRDFSKTIDVSLNYFVRAEDATGAYGSNVVDCKETSVYFGLAKLGAGPGRDTVAVDIALADQDTIQTACTKGFPRPKQIFGELGPGEAYVPPGHEKKARFVIDLTTSKAVPEAKFGKP